MTNETADLLTSHLITIKTTNFYLDFLKNIQEKIAKDVEENEKTKKKCDQMFEHADTFFDLPDPKKYPDLHDYMKTIKMKKINSLEFIPLHQRPFF